MPFSPVASISSITVEGTATTDYETYGLDDTIVSLNMLPSKEVKVTYVTSGLSDDLLKQAISQLVATYYDNRNDFVVGSAVNEVLKQGKNILSSHKKYVYIMRLGDLDTRVLVKRLTKSSDGYGGFTSTSATQHTIWASVKENIRRNTNTKWKA